MTNGGSSYKGSWPLLVPVICQVRESSIGEKPLLTHSNTPTMTTVEKPSSTQQDTPVIAVTHKRKYQLDERSLSVSSISSTDSEDRDQLDEKLDNDSSASNSDSESDSNVQLKKRKITTIVETETTTTFTIPDKQSALVITSFEEPFSVSTTHPVPSIEPQEVLIENKFIGLNPIDWKGKKYRFGVYSFPWVQGRESSGVIRAVGKDVEGFEVGDEVFMVSTSYRDLKTSTFQKYTVFDGRLVWKKPESLELKECGGIGVGLVTASSVMEELDVGLFHEEVNETVKETPKKSILVWGGSSGVGSYVIQLAKVAGYEKIIAVSSPKHEEALKKIGATHVLDRFKSTEELKKEVGEIVPEGIQDGVDVVGKQTTDIVVELLNESKKPDDEKKLVAVVSGPSKDLDSKLLDGISVKSVLIKKFHEDVAHGQRLVKRTYELLKAAEINPQKNIKLYNGVKGILKGLEDLEEFGASNEKYVVEL